MLTGTINPCPKPLFTFVFVSSGTWLSNQAKLDFASKDSNCAIVPPSKMREQTEPVIHRQSRCLHVFLHLKIGGGGSASWEVDIPVFGFQMEPNRVKGCPFFLESEAERMCLRLSS